MGRPPTGDPAGLSFRHQRVQRIRRLLRSHSARQTERAFVLEGEKLLAEAVNAGVSIESVYLAPGAAVGEQLLAGAARVFDLAPGVMERVADGFGIPGREEQEPERDAEAKRRIISAAPRAFARRPVPFRQNQGRTRITPLDARHRPRLCQSLLYLDREKFIAGKAACRILSIEDYLIAENCSQIRIKSY